VPDWRGEVAGALNAWLAAVGPGNGHPGWQRLGPATPAGDGWFTVDLRAAPVGPDELDALRLVARSGTTTFRGIEAVHEGGRLRVRAGGHAASTPDLVLETSARAPDEAVQALRERVRRLGSTGLAAELAAGRLAGTPPVPADEPPGLEEGQREALAACASPGLRLVWAPPGTGATTVLAAAVGELLAAGRRVLLVSGSNQAVDDALEAVLGSGAEFAPGELVRVGPSSRAGIAGDERVALPRLVAARHAEVEAERAAVERRLLELLADSARLDELEEALAGYDHVAYLRAAGRQKTEESIDRLGRRVADLSAASQAAGAHTTAAEERLAEAERAWVAVAAARDHLARAERHERQLADLERWLEEVETELHDLQAANRSIERRLTALPATTRSERWNQLVSRRNLRRRWEAGLREYTVVAERASAARETLALQRDLLGRRAAEARAAAEGVGVAEVGRERARLEAARAAADSAQAAANAAAEQLELARAELARAEATPRPTEEERRLVDLASRGDLPAMHAERERLVQRVGAAGPTAGELTATHERLLAELTELGEATGAELIASARLVATTLARSRLHPAVAAATFDVVLVDEAAAASMPELLVAVAAGRRTAVLFGDFRQRGPALPGQVVALGRADVERWLLDDCFGHCGIRSAAQAVATPGCTVLDEQARFGPHVTDLANALAYEGVLRTGRGTGDGDGPEIMLVDTDGLGDLATVRRGTGPGAWWPAGVVLAGALARFHAGQGATVGLLTAYGRQADATLAALRDAQEGPGGAALAGVEVGAISRFQGRAFDVAVVDLVEDGNGRMAGARWDGGRAEVAAARLLTVAVTRASDRLYLIGSGTAAEQARPGSALARVAAFEETGLVTRVLATDHLTPVSAPRRLGPTPYGGDLAAALAQHVMVADVADEHAFSRALRESLEGAAESVWLWAGWAPGRLGKLLPLLRAASARGVLVTAFVPGPRDERMTRPAGQAWLAELATAATQVVHWHGLGHQLVVIDGRVTWLGGLNTLSERRTRAVVVRHDGRRLASFLLDDVQARSLATRPHCPVCAQDRMELVGQGPTLVWRCTTAGCQGRVEPAGDELPPPRPLKGRPSRRGR
jgi:hypothetical protein